MCVCVCLCVHVCLCVSVCAGMHPIVFAHVCSLTVYVLGINLVKTFMFQNTNRKN